jgi:hypothetical protein
MNQRQWLRTVLFAAVLSSLLTALVSAHLKGGARALEVDRSGPQLNQALNRLMADRKLSPLQATRVVPVFSIRSGSYLGAAQVTGPDEQLEKVKAVAQLEGSFSSSSTGTSSNSSSTNSSGTNSSSRSLSASSSVDFRALVPVTARSVSNLSRVPGVGVSGLVDIKL